MRPLLQGDISMAARVLYGLQERTRPARIRRLFAEAEAADRHRRATGQAHPVWGGGSLMGAAARMPRPPEPDLDDPTYRRCWILVLEASLAARP